MIKFRSPTHRERETNRPILLNEDWLRLGSRRARFPGRAYSFAAEERQLRYHTERIKWDVYWVLAGRYSATDGIIEVRRFYDLVLRFDDRPALRASAGQPKLRFVCHLACRAALSTNVPFAVN